MRTELRDGWALTTEHPASTMTRHLLPILAIALMTAGANAYPKTLFSLTGQGDLVTANISFPTCYKAVLKWRMTPATPHHLAVFIHSVETKTKRLLVNAAGTPSGESLCDLKAGTYFFEISGLGDGWTLDLECRD